MQVDLFSFRFQVRSVIDQVFKMNVYVQLLQIGKVMKYLSKIAVEKH
jgi:hypothetical protein